MATAQHQQKIFISYARDGGGREFAGKIRKELTSYGFNLWQDIVAMEGGESWFHQIIEAIENSVVMVLVLNDAALASNNVRDEWQHARKIGIPILPVTESDTIFTDAPRWLGKNHIFILDPEHPDYEQQHESWLKQLNNPSEFQPRHFHTPILPDYYIKREAEYNAVRDQLIVEPQKTDDKKETMVAITTALQGGGGFGKTTIARALCLDDEVRFRYDDGVLWVTLGEQPDVVTVINNLIKILKPETEYHSDINVAADTLKNLFDTRDILLIIDDIWHEKYLPSLTRSKHAVYLITTRLQSVVSYARAEAVTVDDMKTDEAANLLARQIGHDVSPDDLTDMAKRLGEWALLLEIAGAELRKLMDRGRTLDKALEYVTNRFEKKGITYLEQPSEDERSKAVQVSLEMSLKRLRDIDNPVIDGIPDACDKRFLELGIFKDDAVIPFSTIRLLWGQTADFDEIDTEDALEAMAQLSLFTRYDPADGIDNGTLTLHDVTREILLLLLAEANDMPDPQSLHHMLIETYNIVDTLTLDLVRKDPEYNLPDAYGWEQVAYHLIEAGQTDTLVGLLTDYHWLYAKLLHTSPNAIIVDCDLCLDAISDNAQNVIRLIQSAIRISAHIIGDDPDQLSSQLVGRLVGHKGRYPQIDALIQLVHDLPKPDLLLTAPTLPQAGEGIRHILGGHTGGVNDIAVAGEFIISASSDKTIRVWNWGSGEHIRTLNGHTSAVTAVAVAGELVISASLDRTIRVWNWESGEHIRTLNGHTEWVNDVVITGDFAISVSGSYTSTYNAINVWNWKTGNHIRILDGHTKRVVAVAVAGEFIISASDDHALRVWNWESGEHIRTLNGHTGGVNDIAVADEFIISASSDATLRIWNWQSGEYIRVLEGHTNSVNTVTVSGIFAISGSLDATLRIWNWESGEHISTLYGHTESVDSLAIVGDFAISGSHSNILCVWNWIRTEKGITSTSFSPSSGINKSMVSARTLQTDEYIYIPKGHTSFISAVAITGDHAVSASFDNTLRVWDWKTGKAVRALIGHTDSVNDVTVSGDFAISASFDHTLRIWNWRTGDHIGTLYGHTAGVNAVAVSGDFAISASGSDNTLRVWNWKTGELIRIFAEHTNYIYAMTVSGDFAISASTNKSLQLWNWRTGDLLETLINNEQNQLNIAQKYDGLSLNLETVTHNRFSFIRDNNRIYMFDRKSQTQVSTFTMDGRLSSLNVSQNVLVLGDIGGPVHFLEIKDR